MNATYKISARAYLKRARSLLASGSLDANFYAAFELRADLEARIAEYLEEWDHVSPAAKKAWQIGVLDTEAKKAFSGNTTVAEFTFSGPNLTASFLYTLVRPDGRKAASMLGDYLHAQKRQSDLSSEWWVDFRALLSRAEAELSFAVSGTLLGPILMRDGRIADMKSEVLDTAPLPLRPDIGSIVEMNSTYHPAETFEIPPDAYAWRG